MDLTGCFLKKSSRGNECILVACHYDSNYIHGNLLKDRKGHAIAESWKQIHSMFQKAETLLETYILDNKISQDLKSAFNQENIIYHLVTLDKHRNNQAERAIQRHKSYFKLGLVGTSLDFPLTK